MKINISIAPDILNGYINVSSLNGDNVINLTYVDGESVENNSCTEILACTILDYVPHTQLVNTLKNYVSKLRHGGKLIIGGTSANVLMKNFLNGDINLKELNDELFGKNEHTHDLKRSLNDVYAVSALLQKNGLKIVRKYIQYKYFNIEAIRQ
jgi:predicted SAM-dependent methyltransferase